MWETRFDPWIGKIPWRRKWQPTPVLLPGESHGWRSLVGYSSWGHKESDTTEQFYSLTHSPTQSESWWRTEEPGMLYSPWGRKESHTTYWLNSKNSSIPYLPSLQQWQHKSQALWRAFLNPNARTGTYDFHILHEVALTGKSTRIFPFSHWETHYNICPPGLLTSNCFFVQGKVWTDM